MSFDMSCFDDCRDFMLTIEIKEDPDDPKERARRAAAKRKQKEAEAAMANNKSKIPVNKSVF